MNARSPNLDRLERMGCGDSAAGGYAAGDESTAQILVYFPGGTVSFGWENGVCTLL